MTDQSGAGVIPDARFQSICQAIDQELKRLPIPGAVVGIALGSQTWASGFGVTSVENPLPVTADTLFQIGSITKTFVATAVMRLAEIIEQATQAYLGLAQPEPAPLTLPHDQLAAYAGQYEAALSASTITL